MPAFKGHYSTVMHDLPSISAHSPAYALFPLGNATLGYDAGDTYKYVSGILYAKLFLISTNPMAHLRGKAHAVINEICFIDTPMTVCALCDASDAMSTPMPRGTFFLSQFSFRCAQRNVVFRSANMQKECIILKIYLSNM